MPRRPGLLAHLNPGGIAVVEPWLTPDAWQDGYVSVDTATGDGLTVARMSVSSRTGRTSHLDLHYLVGDPAGVRYFADRHELTLFTRDEYLQAFTVAGWHTTWQDGGPAGRGLLLVR